jgi:hypothetical protein
MKGNGIFPIGEVQAILVAMYQVSTTIRPKEFLGGKKKKRDRVTSPSPECLYVP